MNIVLSIRYFVADSMLDSSCCHDVRQQEGKKVPEERISKVI